MSAIESFEYRTAVALSRIQSALAREIGCRAVLREAEARKSTNLSDFRREEAQAFAATRTAFREWESLREGRG